MKFLVLLLVGSGINWYHYLSGLQVTYGSVIKLQHDRTKYRLHSHEVPYGSGSGQQSVTGFPGVEDANSYWVSVQSPHKIL